ncbi:MAG: peptidoglycan DD-metalloendopeptidase family protein [Pedococcus sp.]
MRSLAPVLLPVAATALVVSTVSSVAAPSQLSDEAAPRPPTGVEAAAPGELMTSRAPGSVSAGPGSVSAGPGSVDRLAPRGRWVWPLRPRPEVARPFIRPASTWGAGHRGVDLTSSTGSEVRAVDAGVVGHVGVIAGRGTVTVVHRSGLRSTYEPVDTSVGVGATIARGQLLGVLTAGGHCSPAACLHLGALRGDAYVDPSTLLGLTTVRLLPLR